jgi:hypothetical protein
MVVAGKTAVKVGAWRGFSRRIHRPDPLQRARRLW